MEFTYQVGASQKADLDFFSINTAENFVDLMVEMVQHPSSRNVNRLAV